MRCEEGREFTCALRRKPTSADDMLLHHIIFLLFLNLPRSLMYMFQCQKNPALHSAPFFTYIYMQIQK